MTNPEPLRGKRTTSEFGYSKYGHLFNFEDVKSAVEFYKKYKWEGGDSFKRLIEDVLYREQLTVYVKWMDYKKEIIEQYVHNISKAKESGVEGYAESLYNDWLLEYCFRDILYRKKRVKKECKR